VYSSVSVRQRDTNFKLGYRSVIWRSYDQGLRDSLNRLGLPYGRKSETVRPPEPPFSEVDYFRGLIDGDGSLGFTAAGFPFLSFATKSPFLARAYQAFVARHLAKSPGANPNRRDAMFNLCVYKEEAQSLACLLYYPACLSLQRKFESARRQQAWVRPLNMVRITWERRRWTPVDDAIVSIFPVPEASELLSRTERSVHVRRFRLACEENQCP
jgi:hypothetical protein